MCDSLKLWPGFYLNFIAHMNTTANKENAVAFYDLMFNQCEPAQAIEKFVGDVTYNTIHMWVMASRHSLNIFEKMVPVKK